MPYFIKLNEIINILQQKSIFISALNLEIESNYTGIAIDSRKVKPGNIFICLSGYNTDGHLFFQSAIDNGASLIIGEKDNSSSYPSIIVSNSRLAAAFLCREFYRLDDKKMKIIGITGTNGKSTTAFLSYQLAMKIGKKAGFIGTIGYYINNHHYPTSLTTPDVVEITSILAEMQDTGVEVVFLEASSHALAMERLAGLYFTAALFLNLSQDHLDFHANLDEYAACKFKLFNQIHSNGLALINIDDKFGRQLWDTVSKRKYSVSGYYGNILYNIDKINFNGSQFTLYINNEIFTINSPLIGEFNIFNLSFAIAAVSLSFPDIELGWIIEKIPSLCSVPGRLEQINNIEQKNILIDYAHTPDAITKVTQTIAKVTNGRLITIIGAGGNRDRKKRPLMLKAALEFSDLVIITTDNPRNEEPTEIIRDIMQGSSTTDAVWIKENRSEAIQDALWLSCSEDTILICGKGHEIFQEIKGQKLPFDDRQVIKDYYEPGKYQSGNRNLSFDRIMIEFICKGEISHCSNCQIKNIITDTRKLIPESLFIPLSGGRFDGHSFLQEALKYPSNITLCKNTYNIIDDRIIKVKDTLEAYGLIARSYRRLFKTKVIAITGSTGKTSVKEYLYNILQEKGKTLKTYSNENNYIGVSKTLLNITNDNKYVIIELGTNHFGEIKWLTYVTDPDIAVITNIGTSHLEFLHDEDGVFSEKIEIFSEGAQVKIFPGDDRKFCSIEGSDFGFEPERKFRIHNLNKIESGYAFKINDKHYLITAKAKFQVTNAAIAITTALHLGVSHEMILKGLQKELDLPLRLQEISSGEKLIIADCYNANPQSMQAAIEYWQSLDKSRPHVAILGSMLELGKHSVQKHTEIGSYLQEIPKHLLISIGNEAFLYHARYHFNSIEELVNSNILIDLPENAIVLIKGSHGIHLENLLKKYNPDGLF